MYQLNVNGTVTLNNATLTVATVNSFVPVVGQSYTIINNGGAPAVSGTFNGLPEGASVPITGSALHATISYIGGDGNG